MTLAPIDDALRAKNKIDPKVKGLLVTEIDPKSKAAEKGIKVGDVIVEAAQDPTATVDDLIKSIAKVRRANRPAILLRVEGGKSDVRFIAVPLDP